jgi:hypothetical protein
VPYVELPHSAFVHIRYHKSFMSNLFLVANSLSLNELVMVKQNCNNNNVKFLPKSKRWFDQLQSCPPGLTDTGHHSQFYCFISARIFSRRNGTAELGSISGDFMRNLWWRGQQWGRVSSEQFGFTQPFHHSTSAVQSSIIWAWNNRAIWDQDVRGICFTPFQINYVRSNLLG